MIRIPFMRPKPVRIVVDGVPVGAIQSPRGVAHDDGLGGPERHPGRAVEALHAVVVAAAPAARQGTAMRERGRTPDLVSPLVVDSSAYPPRTGQRRTR